MRIVVNSGDVGTPVALELATPVHLCEVASLGVGEV